MAALCAARIPAVGLFGVVRASRKSGPWGFVGTDLGVDRDAINGVLNSRRVPVIATLALGPDCLLNVNGDETAAAVAVGMQSSELVFLTDVEGVRNADGAVIDHVADVAALLGAAFVTGGMRPKLRAVQSAMEGGVSEVRIGRTIFGRKP